MTSPAAPGFDRRWLILGVTSLGTFMSILDTTILNVALPNILRDFNADLKEGHLILSVYLLALALVIPLSGYCTDRFGMKRTYMVTLFAFTAGSALCGFSWNEGSLISFRALQGLGGGMLQPISMALVYTIITPLERGRFMPVLGLPLLLAPILGPTIGGYMVDYASWRWIFFLNLPVGIINLGLAWFFLKESPRKTGIGLDVKGLALATLAFPALLIGLSLGQRSSWLAPLVLGLFAFAVPAIVLLFIVESRQAAPLLRVQLFKARMFTLGMAMQFTGQFSLFGLQFLMPLYFQTGYGLSASHTGLLLLPAGIAAFIAVNFTGRYYNRFGPKVFTFAGSVMLMGVTLAFGMLRPSTPTFVLGILATARGLAMGLTMLSIQTAMFNAIPRDSVTRATVLTQMGFRIFGSMSVALLTTSLAVSLTAHGAPAGSSIVEGTAPTAFVFDAFRDTFLALSALAVAGACLSLFIRDKALDDQRAARAKPAVDSG
ncbi:MAG: DHA2 family efflux MFS transporter permease subunit [Dehalococcoidia bacterium]|nr:DHA2 family efflux MFS transporter permease subunit [Dehalococcoidia bacterium]